MFSYLGCFLSRRNICPTLLQALLYNPLFVIGGWQLVESGIFYVVRTVAWIAFVIGYHIFSVIRSARCVEVDESQ